MKSIAKKPIYDLVAESIINLDEITAKVAAVKAMMRVVEIRCTYDIFDKLTKTCKGCKYVSAKLDMKSNISLNTPSIFCSRLFPDKYESTAEGGKE